jgi:DNA-binding transcriptional LysR family regulator
MDRLAAMTAFVRVADTHSFSEAARRLRISKSLVSRQVAALEAELGARLFNRTTRSLALTEAGRSYYDQLVQILADIDTANQSVSSLQGTPRGVLRINAPMTFGINHLAPALPDFLTLCPEVEIDITMNDRFVDLTEEGFDMAIRIGRLGESSLVARKLAPMRRMVCASPDYLARHGTPATPDDLQNHACLRYSNMSAGDEWGFHHPDGRPWPAQLGRTPLRVNNGDTMRIAALKGLGMISVPSFMVGPDVQAGTLASILTPFIRHDGGVYAVYPPTRHLSPKVRAFVDFLADRFGPTPYWDLVE